MSNRPITVPEPEKCHPEGEMESDVSEDLRKALEAMAAFSRNPAPEHEVKRTGSYTIVKPLR
jgi:hypothetical protein